MSQTSTCTLWKEKQRLEPRVFLRRHDRCLEAHGLYLALLYARRQPSCLAIHLGRAHVDDIVETVPIAYKQKPRVRPSGVGSGFRAQGHLPPRAGGLAARLKVYGVPAAQAGPRC